MTDSIRLGAPLPTLSAASGLPALANKTARVAGVAGGASDAAATALATAQAKNKTFALQPTTPYAPGDIWIDSGGIIRRCTTARATGAYVAADWTLWIIRADYVAANIAMSSPIITGGTITGGVITGTQIMTAATSKRIHLNSAEAGSIDFWADKAHYAGVETKAATLTLSEVINMGSYNRGATLTSLHPDGNSSLQLFSDGDVGGSSCQWKTTTSVVGSSNGTVTSGISNIGESDAWYVFAGSGANAGSLEFYFNLMTQKWETVTNGGLRLGGASGSLLSADVNGRYSLSGLAGFQAAVLIATDRLSIPKVASQPAASGAQGIYFCTANNRLYVVDGAGHGFFSPSYTQY